MAPSMKNLQLTSIKSDDGDGDDLEDVRLLDSYEGGDIFDKIEDGLKRIQVRVTGMTCAACSSSVEGALLAVNGVHKASVALLQNKADVLFDPSLVTVSYFFNFLGFFLV